MFSSWEPRYSIGDLADRIATGGDGRRVAMLLVAGGFKYYDVPTIFYVEKYWKQQVSRQTYNLTV